MLTAGCQLNDNLSFGHSKMSIVLNNQITASDRSADELEQQLMERHQLALISFEVRDLAASVVIHFNAIADEVLHWKNVKLTADQLKEIGEGLETLYRRLPRLFERTAKLIKHVEGGGPEVEGKAEFFKTWRELRGIVCFSHDQISNAVGQIERGEVVPLEDIKRALLGVSGN